MFHINLARPRRVAVVAPIIIIAAACSSAGSSSAPAASASAAPSASASGGAASGAAVTAKETEFKIDLSTTTAAPGSVTFDITNGGTIVHEFVVMKTDLAADKLPVDASKGAVNEDASSISPVDEVEDIAVGANAKLTVDLPAGHYVVICNLPGHYIGGMHADFTTK
jgi:uncharacterized cupredoxin-like copper-binding protein